MARKKREPAKIGAQEIDDYGPKDYTEWYYGRSSRCSSQSTKARRSELFCSLRDMRPTTQVRSFTASGLWL
jgi:hypothetical protein